MNVLGLCTYPVESAATRYRLSQFVSPLAERSINLTVSPFFDSKVFAGLYQPGSIIAKAAGMAGPVLHRAGQTFSVGKYDLIYVQREAMLFGPAIFERLYQLVGRVPMVLDLDDATYLSYESPTYGKLGKAFKFFGKVDSLIKQARFVTCGNDVIADHVEKLHTESVILPTVVDTDIFRPVNKDNEIPVIGWIGTYSTFPFLRELFPVFRDLAKKHRFILRIVGAGTNDVANEGFEVDNREWKLDRETSDFQSLDIGLYPLFPGESVKMEWILGKSGFKAIQYLAVGIPFVMTPVGICATIGEPNRTHFNASSLIDWYNALDMLLSDPSLRTEMGSEARKHSLEKYGLARNVDILADTFGRAVAK